jgi:hypothetical protein
MVEGGTFIINIDDSDVLYESLYDPDLKEFYCNSSFPSQIMNLTQLGIKEVYQRVLSGTQYSGKPLSSDFKVRRFNPPGFKFFLGRCLEQTEDPAEQGPQ